MAIEVLEIDVQVKNTDKAIQTLKDVKTAIENLQGEADGSALKGLSKYLTALGKSLDKISDDQVKKLSAIGDAFKKINGSAKKSLPTATASAISNGEPADKKTSTLVTKGKELDVLKKKLALLKTSMSEALGAGQIQKAVTLRQQIIGVEKKIAKLNEALKLTKNNSKDTTKLVSDGSEIDILNKKLEVLKSHLAEALKGGDIDKALGFRQQIDAVEKSIEKINNAANKANDTPLPVDKQTADIIRTGSEIDVLNEKLKILKQRLQEAFDKGNTSEAISIRSQIDSVTESIEKLKAESGKSKQESPIKVDDAFKAAISKGSELDALKSKLEILQAEFDAALGNKQAKKAVSLKLQIVSLTKKIEKLKDALAKGEDAPSTWGRLGQNISKLGIKANKASTLISKMVKSLGRIAFYRMIRSAIKAVTEALTEGSENAYYYSKAISGDLAQAYDYMATKSQTMKNQLGSAWTGLVQTVMPIILRLINYVTKLANVMAQVFAVLGGRSTYLKATDSMTEWAKATQSAAGAAQDLKDATIGIDELNVISPDQSGGGSGTSTPDYSSMFKTSDISGNIVEATNKIKEALLWVKEHIGEILAVAIAIKLAMLGWTIGSALKLDLLEILGLMALLAGSVLTIYGLFDMWTTGIDWENLSVSIAGITLVVLGLWAVVGALAAKIALLVGGIALLVIGIKDWIEKGELTKESLTAILVGVIAIGAALSLLTGSWIPAVIAVVVGAATYVLSHLKGLGEALSTWFKAEWESIKALFSGDLEGVVAAEQKAAHAFDNVKWESLQTSEEVESNADSSVSSITEAFNGLFDGITSDSTATYDALSEQMSSIVDQSIASNESIMAETSLTKEQLEEVLGGAIEETSQTFQDTLDEMKKSLKTFISDLADEIKKIDVKLVEEVAEIVNKVKLDMSTTLEDIAVGLEEKFAQMELAVDTFLAMMKSKYETFESWLLTDKIPVLKEEFMTLCRHMSSEWGELCNDISTNIETAFENANTAARGAAEGIKSAIEQIPTTLTVDVTVNYTSSSGILSGIPKSASGGIIRGFAGGGLATGQLFVAREAGPELVAGIGNGQTAVMNNNQIVESVSEGVYRAVASAMGERSTNSNVAVYLDGKQIETSVRKTKQRRGATIATGGLYNYT